MSSSRASSPASDGGLGSPTQLSPRSRIRALLAAVDSDSDGEAPSASKNPNLLSASEAHVIPGSELERALKNNTGNTGDDVEDEEDDVLVKPHGRLAARMNVVSNKPGVEDSDEADPGRVTEGPFSPLTKTAETATERRLMGSSESEDTRTVSRKRKIRKTRISTPRSNPPQQSSPEGMFVSPTRQISASPRPHDSSSDEDLPANPMANARFLALVAKKREERHAKEAEIRREKAKKAEDCKILEKNHSDMLEDDAMEYSDEENGGQRLTQQARPTRKASKKALEEMHRETQRMSRNMQLAHEARTKKKITKSSLFAKFNYKPVGSVEVEESIQPANSSSPLNTDAEMHETPPTSPNYLHDDLPKGIVAEETSHDDQNEMINEDSEEDLAILSEALSRKISSSPPALPAKVDKGKGMALQEPKLLTGAAAGIPKGPLFTQKPRVLPPKLFEKAALGADDSDSDLEIVATKTPVRKIKKDSIFDRVPARQARESHSLHALRMLAQVTSPGKEVTRRNAKPSMTVTELTISLQQRARQQATRDREERLQALRDRGVIVQTAEERQKEMADVEDLIAKARREGEELMKKEKDALRKERKANGGNDPLGESSDDEEWEEEKEIFAEQMSASGSESDENADGEESDEEEEENDVEEADVNEEEANPAGILLDNEASESESEENIADESEEEDTHFINDDEDVPAAAPRRRINHMVVSDDDDEDGTPAKPVALPRTDSPLAIQYSPAAPPSVLRSATKTFIPGLTVAGPAGLGLTQIFAGTMDDSQSQASDGSPRLTTHGPQRFNDAQHSLAFLRNLPAPDLPAFEPTMDDDSQDIVQDSQNQISQIPDSPSAGKDSQDLQLDFTQSQVHGFDSLVQDPFATQLSEFPEPTQDAGFQEMSPIKGRFAEPPPSTVDTVVLEETPVPESPVLEKRKGKLRRRVQMSTFSDDDEEVLAPPVEEGDEFDISANVFDVMRKASKRKEVAVDEFDKKKSGAKEMVHEQAEESEDEYAGLGGASEDESGGEADAFVKEMIDDEAGKDADESKLAAFYADKERANDSKQVEKLFRDITNGTLRRKRGADYSLSDSDDDGEARRRMKRRDFAKMRKALLEDERIGKIAENPKKLAFLRAIEDHGEDDEMDFLDDLNDSQGGPDSQSQSQVEELEEVSQVDDSQTSSAMGPPAPKRKLSSDAEGANRLPPNLRRTKQAKRPSNLSEVRESLSSLIEAPNAFTAADSSDSDSELEVEGAPKGQKGIREKENKNPFARRNTSVSVVDRISLKRASSSDLSTSARLAFAAPSSTPGFKVPALLRRATTNSSISSISGSSVSSGVSGTERSAGGFGDEKVPKKAGRNSGVQYMARENERKSKFVDGEKKREERRWRGAVVRRKVVGGLFGAGKFE